MEIKMIRLTRRTRVGWGYNTMPRNNGTTAIMPTTVPDHVGTVKTVIARRAADRDYQSMRNGTYMSTAWFIRKNGRWVEIEIEETDLMLLYESPGYRYNSIVARVA